MFGPIFEAASEKHPDVVFAKVDTEAERELAGAAGITSIPTLMAFRDGILLFRQPGALPAPSLEELITAIKSTDMEEIKKEIATQEMQSSEGK
jgi:thioredoxin 1